MRKRAKSWPGHGDKNPVSRWWEPPLVRPLWEQELPQNTKTRTARPSSNPPSAIYPKVMETPVQKHTCNPGFTAALFTRAEPRISAPRPRRGDYIKKTWYTAYTVEYYSAIKTEEILPGRTWVILEGFMLSVSHRETVASLICGNLRKPKILETG